jgi:hypothetical protein
MKEEKEAYRIFFAGLYKYWLRYVKKFQHADMDVYKFADLQVEGEGDYGKDGTMAEVLLSLLMEFVLWAKRGIRIKGRLPVEIRGQFSDELDMQRMFEHSYNYGYIEYMDKPFILWPSHGRLQWTVAEYLEAGMLAWFNQGGLYLTEQNVKEIMFNGR